MPPSLTVARAYLSEGDRYTRPNNKMSCFKSINLQLKLSFKSRHFIAASFLLFQLLHKHERDCYLIENERDRMERNRMRNEVSEMRLFLKISLKHYWCLCFYCKLWPFFVDIERRKNRLLKFCYVPPTSAAHNRLLFFFFCCGHLQN